MRALCELMALCEPPEDVSSEPLEADWTASWRLSNLVGEDDDLTILLLFKLAFKLEFELAFKIALVVLLLFIIVSLARALLIKVKVKGIAMVT